MTPTSTLPTEPCSNCGGQGFTPSAVHYEKLGLSPVTYCQSCALGRRLLRQWANRPEQRAYSRALAQEKVRRALELSCLGLRFTGRRLEDLLGDPLLRQACADYLQAWPSHRRRGEGLYLWGLVGSGKTHTAAVLVNELVEEHLVETLFLNLPEVAARLRESLREQGGTDGAGLIDHMKRVELLVLDDLGVERPSAWTGEMLYRVIDERWRTRRPMIVTSNLSPARLVRRYRPQIVSRLEGCCRPLELRARDRRTRGSGLAG